jgi:hypothetical protein
MYANAHALKERQSSERARARLAEGEGLLNGLNRQRSLNRLKQRGLQSVSRKLTGKANKCY